MAMVRTEPVKKVTSTIRTEAGHSGTHLLSQLLGRLRRVGGKAEVQLKVVTGLRE